MLKDDIKRLATGPNFGTIATLQSDGSPAAHVMWVDCDDHHIILNTETARAKYRNILRDPRVSVVIWDAEDPYNYVEVRGRVIDTITGPEARKHIDKLSEKYTGGPYKNPIFSERVILKIEPERRLA